jgi:hypothetical protein
MGSSAATTQQCCSRCWWNSECLCFEPSCASCPVLRTVVMSLLCRFQAQSIKQERSALPNQRAHSLMSLPCLGFCVWHAAKLCVA